jgi:asparagine synthetase B (glutamine-hydrolysing)
MDHLAIKPLYWNTATGAIASEMRALRSLDRLELNEHYLSKPLTAPPTEPALGAHVFWIHCAQDRVLPRFLPIISD